MHFNTLREVYQSTIINYMQKKAIPIIFSILFVLAIFVVWYLYQKSRGPVLPPPPVTQESVAQDLRTFTPDPEILVDPKIIEEELKTFEVQEEKKLSNEQIMQELLNNPEIEPLPKSR